MSRTISIFVLLWFSTSAVWGQAFVETGCLYPLEADGSKYAVSGFTSFDNKSDEEILANTLLWIVENICPKELEGITHRDIKGQTFKLDLTLGSIAGSGSDNIYYCRAIFRIAEGKLVYYLSDVLVESPVFVMRKVTPLEKLTPEKKTSHKQTMDDFVQTESLLLNKLFDFVSTNQPNPITHWEEIAVRKAVKGMNEDECRLAFGKPQTILETNGEIQWMYNSSFYLFFKNGKVQTIIK
ncbi:hypothetical protein [Parabacteroides sp.]